MQDENSLPEGKGDVLIYKALQQVDIFSMNTEKSKLTILCEGRCERKLNKIYWKAIYWKSDWWVVVGFGFLFVCFAIEDFFIEGNHKMEFSGAKNDHELRMMVAMHLLSLLTKEKEKLTCLWKKKSAKVPRAYFPWMMMQRSMGLYGLINYMWKFLFFVQEDKVRAGRASLRSTHGGHLHAFSAGWIKLQVLKI